VVVVVVVVVVVGHAKCKEKRI